MRTILTSIIVAAAALPSVAAAQDAPATSDQDVIITGSKYRGDIATSGARIDVSTRDLPLSISVLTDALIQDRQVRNLRDLADNVAGVRSRQSGSGAFTIDFTIRGLQGGNGSVVAVNCQPARDLDPLSAFNIDPVARRDRTGVMTTTGMGV